MVVIEGWEHEISVRHTDLVTHRTRLRHSDYLNVKGLAGDQVGVSCREATLCGSEWACGMAFKWRLSHFVLCCAISSKHPVMGFETRVDGCYSNFSVNYVR